MNQFSVQKDEHSTVFDEGKLLKNPELEHQQQQLKEERRQFEQERKKFEQEKQEFYAEKKNDDMRTKHEKKLFDMKWRILEGELRKLAAEKEQIERQRDFYRYVNQHEAETYCSSYAGKKEVFFSGVTNKEALKKRYKDLIKIYHPDNINGDKKTLQEINLEYEKIKTRYQ